MGEITIRFGPSLEQHQAGVPPFLIIGGVQHLMHIVGLDSDESEIGVGVSLEQHQADNQSIHSD